MSVAQASYRARVGALILFLLGALAQGPLAQTPATGAISGVVTDAATKRPIAGAIAVLRILGPPGPRTSQQVTDVRGRFVFDELVASTQYILDVSKPGYLDGHYSQLRGQPVSSRFALTEGQWLSTADVELTKIGAIGGVVSDEFGEPVVGAFVRALAEITVGGRRQLAAGPITKTDDRGEYRLTGLLPAHYVVMLPSIQHSVPATATPAQIEDLREDMYARLEAALARNPATPHVNNGAIGDGATRLIIGNFVTPPAPVNGHDRAYPITFFPGRTSIASATRIDLSDAGEKSGVNISIQPVTAVRVSGRVDGMMTPARLTLRLVPAGLEGLAGGSEAATTIANPDGTFTFLSVPTGAYTLDPRQTLFEFTSDAVYIPGTPSLPRTPGKELLGGQFVGLVADASIGAGYSVRYAPGDNYSGRTPLTVGSTDISNLTVAMQPELVLRGRYVYEDLSTAPPQRATITFAEPADGNWALGVAASWNEGPDSDPAVFSIRGMSAGAYVLRPTPPTGTVVKSIVVDGQDHLRKPIEMTAGRDLNVVVTFTGKIPMLTGSAHTSQGLPAARMPVLAFSTDRGTWSNLGLVPMLAKLALTSPEGTFTISTLPAGEYFVTALDMPAGARGWTDPAFLAKAAGQATRVSLEPGAAKSVQLTTVVVR
jgi:carboxypeptidase family protein